MSNLRVIQDIKCIYLVTHFYLGTEPGTSNPQAGKSTEPLCFLPSSFQWINSFMLPPPQFSECFYYPTQVNSSSIFEVNTGIIPSEAPLVQPTHYMDCESSHQEGFHGDESA